MGPSQNGCNHLQVRRNVTPRRHNHIGEDSIFYAFNRRGSFILQILSIVSLDITELPMTASLPLLTYTCWTVMPAPSAASYVRPAGRADYTDRYRATAFIRFDSAAALRSYEICPICCIASLRTAAILWATIFSRLVEA